MNTFMSHIIYPYDIDYLGGNQLTDDDNIFLYQDSVTIQTLDKPTFIFNYFPEIHFQILSPPTKKNWVFGIYVVEQLRPSQKETLKGMLLKMQSLKEFVMRAYEVNTHLVILTNFEQNKHILDRNELNSPVEFQTFFLPYQITEFEQTKLSALFSNVEKEYDVAFVGALSERRKESIRLCEKEGLRVNVIQNKFAEERDKETAKCRIFMASHYYDNSSMYPNIRFDRILFQDMPILSESCSDTDILDIKDYVSFAPLMDIGKKAKELLKNPPLLIPSDKKREISESRLKHLQSIKQTLLELMRK